MILWSLRTRLSVLVAEMVIYFATVPEFSIRVYVNQGFE